MRTRIAPGARNILPSSANPGWKSRVVGNPERSRIGIGDTTGVQSSGLDVITPQLPTITTEDSLIWSSIYSDFCAQLCRVECSIPQFISSPSSYAHANRNGGASHTYLQ
jgi:hypothetical protein